MLVFDCNGVLTHRSDNVQSLLGDVAPALGEKLSSRHFSSSIGFHDLIAQTQDTPQDDPYPHVIQIFIGEEPFDAVAHRIPDGVICEFESTRSAVKVPDNFAFTAHRSVERLKRQTSVQSLLNVAVEELRRMTGFDRVMAYRFRHDDSGDVVAEAVCDELDPFLGRRYPASDIPAQARRLYVLSTLRLIADVQAIPVRVQAADASLPPLDMSHAVLRSVSPIHIEYLSNMGVAASMSVSIVLNGKLWGMLACHHMTARQVPYRVRMSCDVMTQLLASNIQSALAKDFANRAVEAASLRSRVVERALHSDDILHALNTDSATLLEGFHAESLVLADNGKILTAGGLPLEVASDLIEWLTSMSDQADRMVLRDNLNDLPHALRESMGVWCGFLALRFGAEIPMWVVLVRKEQIETINWGGKPDKELVPGPLGPRLTPRGSFDLWKETVSGSAVPWNESDLDAAQKLLDELLRADAARVAEISRARGQVMALLGHGLQDPLSSISNDASQLKSTGNTYGDRIQSSSSRLERLVGQVMDISLLHGGKGLSLRFEEGNLVEALERWVQKVREAFPNTKIMIVGPNRLNAQFDAERLSQVVATLVRNACQHSEPSEPVLVQLSQNGAAIDIEVSNSGKPLPEHVAANLFQPFKRSDPESFANASDLGLGLFIANQIAQAHGGSLTYSFAEPYVVFTATFPAVQAA